jgi:hypothetical protein
LAMADRPGASDQHIFTQQIERKCRMDRVAKRIKTGKNIQRNLRIGQPNVRLGHGKILGEGPGAVDANPVGLVAEMPASGQTVPTASANNMAFTRHDHAGMEIDHMTSNGFYDADELVTDLHRRRNSALGPGIPVIDVDIGAAD